MPVAQATVSFAFLGGGEVADISPDGAVVVGGNYDTGTNGVWDHGAFAPVSIPAPYTGAGPGGISADGTTLVGSAWRFFPGGSAKEAVRWNGLGNPTLMGDLPGGQDQAWANRCCADGSVAVGVGYDGHGSQPVRWTASGIERLGGGVSYYGGNATGVSANGSVIVGTIWLSENGPSVPFRWTQAQGMQLLADPSMQGGAATITPDGSLIVGGIDGQAFRWTQPAGLQLLGMLDPQMPGATAIATSADGSIVVGQSPFGFPQDSADGFVWDSAHGMRSLTTLITDLGFDLQGEVIEQADAISADGTIIAGRAFGPLGGQVFVLTVPEPGSLAAGMGVMIPMALARRRRRHGRPRFALV